MERLIVLGTGNAMATECYNTCFALQQDCGIVLADAGGGNGILSQMKKAGLRWDEVRHLIVTHEHCDHLLGVVWVIRKIATLLTNDQYKGNFQIWCHIGLRKTIITLAQLTLQKKFVDLIEKRIFITVVVNGEKVCLLSWPVTFFDIHSTKAQQFGFSVQLQSGEKLTCLGDEPFNPLCEKWIEGTNTLLCEAFCLYSQREKFKPYDKHHSTVREACELAQTLQIPRLVLWHTEDQNYSTRKTQYLQEGRIYYQGELCVPYDLDVIDFSI